MSEKSVTLEIKYCCEYESVCFLGGSWGQREISYSQNPMRKVNICSRLEHSCEDESMFSICHYN